MVRIVVLDGYTLNPGDLSWQPLEALGQVTVYDRTAAADVLTRVAGAEILLTNKTVLGRETIEQLPKLRYIGVLATGCNVVDIEAAGRRGVVVANVPDYGTASVAQMTIAHLLNLTQHVGHHARTVAEGRWSRSADWCYWDFPLGELEGLVMGIVGLGRIGQAVARLAEAFGMRVVGHDPQSAVAAAEGIRRVELDEIFALADVVSLHCPLTPQTERLVDARRLAMMKPTALVINTSRGALVDESALAAALSAGRIAGAGLDVLGLEPPRPDNPLLRARNCYITPHVAWATHAARQRLLHAAIDNVRAFLSGRPVNVVPAPPGEDGQKGGVPQ
ncbi:MAG: D-2-hydroxyacid dehydrogenase [Thermoguttaceae bacterium]|jgi:glycerate dehydrogenase